MRLNVSGWLAGPVADELRRRLQQARASRLLSDMVRDAVGRVMSGARHDVYLLPGDGQSLAGRIEDDVTLVLVPR